MQIPADRVIAELATRMGELHREIAILKVQLALVSESQAATPPVTVATAMTPPVPDPVVPPPDLSR